MRKLIVITGVIGILSIGSCVKDTTVIIPKSATAVVITKTVSFKTDLVPLFKSSCALSGCHVTGAHTPDLEAEDAYNALMNGNFIDKATPADSKVYERLTGKLTPGMPLNAPGSDPGNINELLLAWIKQGAKNN